MTEQNINIEIDSNTPRTTSSSSDLIVPQPVQTFYCKFCKTHRNIDYLKLTKCKHDICKTCYFENDDRNNIICDDCKKTTTKILNNIETKSCCDKFYIFFQNNKKTFAISICCFTWILLIMIVSISTQMNKDDNENNSSNSSNITFSRNQSLLGIKYF